jgi:hypothetical protein
VANLSLSVKEPTMKLLVTGGAGFIGPAAFIETNIVGTYTLLESIHI